MHALYLVQPGLRPYFDDIASHLWGAGCDFDSDGNDDDLPSGNWTELTVALRPEGDLRLDIDPLDDAQPLVLVIRSEDKNLAEKAALFLLSQAGGTLTDTPPIHRGNGS